MPGRKRAKSSASTSSGSTTVALARDEQKQAQDRAKQRGDLMFRRESLTFSLGVLPSRRNTLLGPNTCRISDSPIFNGS
jgi:hypothetical protein